MKRITLALLLLFTITTIAQSNSINYKALIKDANNTVVANTTVTVQFQILQGVAQTNVYQETHTPTTDANGIIIINIGDGVVNSGVYANIDWSSDDHFLNTQINSGSGLTDMGTTGFNAVPYALSAKTVENITETDPKVATTFTNVVPIWNGTNLINSSIYQVAGRVGINTNSPDALFNVAGGDVDLGSPNSGIIMAGTVGTNITIDGNEIMARSNTSAAPLNLQAQGGNLTVHTSVTGTQMVIQDNGNVGIGHPTPSQKLDVDGQIRMRTGATNGFVPVSSADGTMTWTDPATFASTAPTGLETIDEGNGNGLIKVGRVAANYGNVGANAVDLSFSDSAGSTTRGATGAYSTALGLRTIASGFGTTVMGAGSTASGVVSFATGEGAESSGFASTAMGRFTRAQAYASVAIGQNNAGGGDPLNWVATDPLFEIGNAVFGNSNALTVLKNGTITAPSFDISEITDAKALVTKEFADASYLDAGGSSIINAVPKWNGTNLVDGSISDVNGDIGIGITSPMEKLHVSGNIKVGNSNALQIEGGQGNLTDWNLSREDLSGLSRMHFRYSNQTGEDDTSGTVMTIETDGGQGNVGIGVSAPTAKLDIAGNVKIVDGTEGAGKVLTSDADGLGSWQDSSLANGTVAGEMLYWDGTQWQNIPAGPSGQYGVDAPTLRYCNGVPTWYECTPPPLGTVFQGGIVFYLDGSGEHGLIAELTDATDSIWRACDTQSVSTSGAVETGEQNNLNAVALDASNQVDYDDYLENVEVLQTQYLALRSSAQFAWNQAKASFCQSCATTTGSNCVTDPAPGGYLICVGTGGTFAQFSYPPFSPPPFTGCIATGGAMGVVGGWWLPSSGELDLMYTNLHALGLGNFSNAIYWSSTQASASTAQQKNFSDGTNTSSAKNITYKIRRIKAF